MHALILALLFGAPPVAPPVVDCPPVAPPTIDAAAVAANPLPDHAGEPIVVEEPPCECGDECRCVDCQCADCPHHSVDANKMVPPPLEITVADRGCPPCERFKADALPRLVRAGWVEGQHYRIRVVPFGSEMVPSFRWHGVAFGNGYGIGQQAWLSWRAALKQAMGDAYRSAEPARVMHDAQPHDAAKPVQAPMTLRADYHVHVCRRCGHSWSHHDSNAGNAAAHRCAACGNYEYLIRSQSGPAPASAPAYRQTGYGSGCPGGNCPPRRGFFGRLFGG